VCLLRLSVTWLQVVGMDTWHHEKNPDGITVEMHGNIRCGQQHQASVWCENATRSSSVFSHSSVNQQLRPGSWRAARSGAGAAALGV
jgi:hypothetical protein